MDVVILAHGCFGCVNRGTFPTARLWQDCYGVALARKQHKEGLEKLANDLKAKYDNENGFFYASCTP